MIDFQLPSNFRSEQFRARIRFKRLLRPEPKRGLLAELQALCFPLGSFQLNAVQHTYCRKKIKTPDNEGEQSCISARKLWNQVVIAGWAVIRPELRGNKIRLVYSGVEAQVECNTITALHQC